MMLPIFISVSVTPLSYFFCASAGATAAARRVREIPSVFTKSLSARFIEFPPAGAGSGVTAFGGRFPRSVFDLAATIAAGGDSRKRRAGAGTAIVRGVLSRDARSAAQQILRREMRERCRL